SVVWKYPMQAPWHGIITRQRGCSRGQGNGHAEGKEEAEAEEKVAPDGPVASPELRVCQQGLRDAAALRGYVVRARRGRPGRSGGSQWLRQIHHPQDPGRAGIA